MDVEPSARTSNVHFTATSHTSAPSRSRTQPRSAANGVRLSTCHMGTLCRKGAQLVDLDGRALDFVAAAGAADDGCASDDYLAGSGQGDARLTALQNDFSLGSHNEAVVVGSDRHVRGNVHSTLVSLMTMLNNAEHN